MKTFGALKHERGSWHIDTEPHIILKLKRVFPKVSRKHHGTIKLTDTVETCRELEWFLSRYPLDVDAKSLERLTARAFAHREQESYVEALLKGIRAPQDFDLALPPRDYQKVAADLCIKQGGLLLADDLGLGKTLVAICIASLAEARPALIVTMTHLPRQWKDEFTKFAPHLHVHVVKQGTPYDMGAPRRKRKGQLSLITEPTPDVIITSYSKLAGWAETFGAFIRFVAYDEAQELRRTGTEKYEAADHISRRAQVRLGLTATPVYNYGGEIFNVMNVIRPDSLGSRAEFLEEWTGGEDNQGRASIANPAAFGTYVREAGLMLRRTRAEVGRELPPLTKVAHTVDADLEHLAKVDSKATELARMVLASNPMARGAKMQAAEELSVLLRQATGVAKAPYVAEFVKMLCETGEKVLLYGWHREVYNIWNERLAEYKPVMYTGTESPTQKRASFDAFTSGESRILIMSLRAGAGLDGLQAACRTVVFGELDYSPGVHDQCTGRPHRDGQGDPVVAYYLISESGSDPIIVDILGIKGNQAAGIRDPNTPLFEKLQKSGDHVRRLAEAYLQKKGVAA
jgi:SNF2 family DNA or RNA helicase